MLPSPAIPYVGAGLSLGSSCLCGGLFPTTSYLRHFYAPKRKPYSLLRFWRQACVAQPRPASRLCLLSAMGRGVRHHTWLLLFAFVGSQNCKRCSFWVSVIKASAALQRPLHSPSLWIILDWFLLQPSETVFLVTSAKNGCMNRCQGYPITPFPPFFLSLFSFFLKQDLVL